jgi:hypothetical protein
VYAAEAGRLELIDSLIMQGAWQAWLWGDTRSTLLFSVDEHYVDNSIWDRLKHITSEKEMAEAKAVIKLRHPLIGAAANGHTDVCRILLSKAVTARATHRALWAAARGGHVPVVQLLLAEAPNSIRDPYLGSNAVECAAEGGHLAVVQLLVQEGVDIEAARWALCSAAREGHLHIVEYLVTALPNVKQQYAAQKALFVAAERNHLQVSLEHAQQVSVSCPACCLWQQFTFGWMRLVVYGTCQQVADFMPRTPAALPVLAL